MRYRTFELDSFGSIWRRAIEFYTSSGNLLQICQYFPAHMHSSAFHRWTVIRKIRYTHSTRSASHPPHLSRHISSCLLHRMSFGTSVELQICNIFEMETKWEKMGISWDIRRPSHYKTKFLYNIFRVTVWEAILIRIASSL